MWEEKQQSDFWRTCFTSSCVILYLFWCALGRLVLLLELASLPHDFIAPFTRSLSGWIAIVNGSTVTQPDINNIPQNSRSTRNKKERGKNSCLLIIWCFHVFLIYFQGTEREAQSQISLSSLTNHCDGPSWPSKGEGNGFLISAATGTCQTNLSYLPATSTVKSRLQLHHLEFVLHQSPKLVGSLWGWRTDSLWTVSHMLIQTVQVQQPWWWWLSPGKLTRPGFAWKPWSYWQIKVFIRLDR